MRDNVQIIKYWIKELRRVAEFKEIAKTEDIEFLRLYGETDRALKNLFIETADEYGVKRLEKVAGIYPDAEDTLEQRKARLYVYWNDKEPYTEGELRNRLESLCGAGNYEIDSDYRNFLIRIIMNVGDYGIFDEITKMLDYFLPANLVLDLQNVLRGEGSAGIYYGVGGVTAMSYTVTNDIKGEYPLTQELYVAHPFLTASEGIITNDISESYSSELTLYPGVGSAQAASETVTNDINSVNELNEEKTVGIAVSTSQVITVN